MTYGEALHEAALKLKEAIIEFAKRLHEAVKDLWGRIKEYCEVNQPLPEPKRYYPPVKIKPLKSQVIYNKPQRARIRNNC
jgi:hypothetical protein